MPILKVSTSNIFGKKAFSALVFLRKNDQKTDHSESADAEGDGSCFLGLKLKISI